MRKLLSLLLTSVMLFTSGSFSVLAKEPSAAEKSSPYSTQETITVSPRIVHSYKKTVKKVYKNSKREYKIIDGVNTRIKEYEKK